MISELGQECEQARWTLREWSYMQYWQHLRDHSLSEFKSHCCEQLEALGDIANDVQRHEEAISQYSAALSLNPTILQRLSVRRRKTHAMTDMWENTLNEANEAFYFCYIQVCYR
jgi:tetratricopeptide (TPR) repeat protein